MSLTNNTTSGIGIDLNNCRIISDPEGYDINQLLNDKEGKNINNGNILVLGDLLDSTFIEDKDNKDKTTKMKNQKKFNIRNLHLVNESTNIFVAMGNRDLNKIKCRQLLTFKEDKEQEFYNFLNKIGQEQSDETSLFLDIVVEFIKLSGFEINKNNTSNTNPWNIEKLTDENGFSPFWNKTRTIDIWNGKNQVYSQNTACFDRFNIIFGRDGKVGTMSAQNLLTTIYYELDELNFFNFLRNSSPYGYYSAYKNSNLDNFKAACVLVFFKLALMDNDSLEVTSKNINLVGLLRKFYTRPQNFICAYKEFGDDKNKQIALFSHGGINSEFIKNNSFYEFKLNNKGSNLDDRKGVDTLPGEDTPPGEDAHPDEDTLPPSPPLLS
jgi:hypothetical protein